MDYRGRLEQVRRRIQDRKLDALVIFDPANVRYLTGFASIAYSRPIACVVPASGRVHLIVPRIELAQARDMTQTAIHSYTEWSVDGERAPGFDEAFLSQLTKVLRIAGITRVLGLEDRSMSRSAGSRLARTLRGWRPRFVPGLIEDLRIRKAPEEVARIKDAAIVAMAGMHRAWRSTKPGTAEIAIRAEGDAAAVRTARERFPGRSVTISSNVLGGPRIAAIHTPASTNPIARGDVVYLVWMAALDGYWVELARTVPVGSPTRRQRDLYRTIQRAHELAAASVRTGTVADDVDVGARAFLSKARLARYFHHRTGHGVGLAGVERPNLGVGDRTVLEPDMVVSVEPGVCIDGFGGVGSSDTLLVTSTGAGHQWLTRRDFLREAWDD